MKEKKRSNKDRIFILVMAIILGNLAYFLARVIGMIIGDVTLFQVWMLIIANIVAIVAVLWLMRSYKHKIREEQDRIEEPGKSNEQEESEEN
jgi:Mn2+/Fe2+ NRAMP family transporter